MQIAKINTQGLKMDGGQSAFFQDEEQLSIVPEKKSPIDVFTQMLESINFECRIYAPAAFKASWGVDVERGLARFYILTSGRCWLEMKGSKYPIFLVRGDLVFIPGGQGHSLRDPMDGAVIPFNQAFRMDNVTKSEDRESDDVTQMICGTFSVKEGGFERLLSGLSPLIHIRGEDRKKQAGLEDLLHVVIHEATSAKTGSQGIINRLVHILFIQAIRVCRDTVIADVSNGNLLAGLTDPEIGQAIRWMNQKPEMPWTVASLAEKVCLSRSVFAARFTSLTGQPPLRYLHQCRMNKACVLLRETLGGIKKIANSIGYSSEAAFSNAFKRWIGRAPGQYRVECRRS
jgi:AraC-like DNA-binding protein